MYPENGKEYLVNLKLELYVDKNKTVGVLFCSSYGKKWRELKQGNK